jgi:protein-tyrosine phosphatase
MKLNEIRSVSVICLGNICRSPMGEVVLRDRLEKYDLDIEVNSGGTGSWHIGEDANLRTIQVLEENNYVINHKVKQVTSSWFDKNDLFLAMDLNNYHDLIKIAGKNNSAKVQMYRRFDPKLKIIFDLDPQLEVPDPYYGNLEDFKNVLKMVENAADGFVKAVINAREE